MPSTININLFRDYKPFPKSLLFHRDNSRFKILCCGTRGGKTYSATREFVKKIYLDIYKGNYTKLHYWIVAPTYSLTKVAQRELFSVLGGTNSPLIYKWLSGERELWLKCPDNRECLIEIKSGDNPDALVSVGLDGLWIDETARISPEAWNGGLRQRLTDRRGWGLFSTTPLGHNWFYNDIVQKSFRDNKNYHPDYSLHTWYTIDNPHIPPDEIQQAKLELPETYFRREYEASFEAFIGQIYQGFNRNIHIIDRVPPSIAFTEIRYGVDWGMRNQGVILVIGKSNAGRYYVLEEIVKTGVLVTNPSGGESWVNYAKQLRSKWGNGVFIADPSSLESITQFQRAGLSTVKADNSVLPGIQTVASLLQPDIEGKPGLSICSNCRVLIAQMESYRWQEKNEIPVKIDDHTVDALRYALHTKFHPGIY